MASTASARPQEDVYDVYIRCSRKDLAWAENLKRSLSESGQESFSDLDVAAGSGADGPGEWRAEVRAIADAVLGAGYPEEFVTARMTEYSAAYDPYRDDLETMQVSTVP
jgi:hypothetical protein